MVVINKLKNTPKEYQKLINKFDKQLPHENSLIILHNNSWESNPVFHVYHNRDTYPNKNSVSITTDITHILENEYEIGTEYFTAGVTGFTSIPKEAPSELTVENCSYDKYGLYLQNISENN